MVGFDKEVFLSAILIKRFLKSWSVCISFNFVIEVLVLRFLKGVDRKFKRELYMKVWVNFS